MIEANWVIDEVERAHIVFQDVDSRMLQSEIAYYYEKYGSVSFADLYTYLQDKKNLFIRLSHLAELQNSYEQIEKTELYDYFSVMKEYNKSQDIKRLERKMSEEKDPKIQAQIGLEIVKLRRGEM